MGLAISSIKRGPEDRQNIHREVAIKKSNAILILSLFPPLFSLCDSAKQDLEASSQVI